MSGVYRLHAVHLFAHRAEQLDVDLADAVDGHEVVVAGVLLDVVVGFFDEVAVLLVEEDFVVALGVEVHAFVEVGHDLDHGLELAFFEVLDGFVHVLEPLLLLEDGDALDFSGDGACLLDEASVVVFEAVDEGLRAVLSSVFVGLRGEHQLEDHALGVLEGDVGHEFEDVVEDGVVGDV